MPAINIITASYDHKINFWDSGGHLTQRPISFPDSQVNCMAVSPDRRYLAAAGYGIVKLFGNANGVPTGQAVGATDASAINGNVSNLHFIKLVNANTLPPSRLAAQSQSSSSNKQQQQQQQGKTTLDYGLIVTGEDGTIKVFTLATASAPSPQQSAGGAVTFMLINEVQTKVSITASSLTPDQQVFFTGSQLGRVFTWYVPALLGLPTTFQQQQPSSSSSTSDAAAGLNGDSKSSNNSVTATRTNSPAAAAGGGGSGTTQQQQQQQPHTTATRPLQELALEADATPIRSIAVAPCANFIVLVTSGGKAHILCFCRGREILLHNSASSSGGKDGQQQQQEQPQVSDNGDASSNQQQQQDAAAATSSPPTLPLTSSTLGTPIRPLRNSNPFYDQTYNPYVVEQYSFFLAHHKFVLRCSVAPNSKYIITASADCTVALWGVPDYLARGNFIVFNDLFLSSSMSAPSPSFSPSSSSSSSTPPSPSNAAPSATGDEPAAAAAGEGNASESSSPDAAKKGSDQAADSSSNTSNSSNSSAAAAAEDKAATAAVPVLTNATLPHNLTQVPFPLRMSLQGHQRWVWDVAPSQCSSYVLTASSDHSGRLWRVDCDLSLPLSETPPPAAAGDPTLAAGQAPPTPAPITVTTSTMSFNGHAKAVNCCLFDYAESSS